MEICLRTFVIFILLMLAVRLMNNRMAGQITVSELAVMITLGAIVSPIMQIPDRGIIFGIIGLAVAVLFQKLVSWLGVKGSSDERWLQGKAAILVEDGHLNLHEIKKACISRQEVFSALRQNNVLNLADVKRMYIEACGMFSIYLNSESSEAGLSISPSKDPDARDITRKSGDGLQACVSCGHVQHTADGPAICEVCGAKVWTTARAIEAEEK